MKLKTTELQEEALDWAVAKCEGRDRFFSLNLPKHKEHCFSRMAYSTHWALAGPIIEREWLDITPWPNESREDMRWHCQQHDTANDFAQYGPTLLIAAMRCYVASKLGDEVEVPDELKEVMA